MAIKRKKRVPTRVHTQQYSDFQKKIKQRDAQHNKHDPINAPPPAYLDKQFPLEELAKGSKVCFCLEGARARVLVQQHRHPAPWDLQHLQYRARRTRSKSKQNKMHPINIRENRIHWHNPQGYQAVRDKKQIDAKVGDGVATE